MEPSEALETIDRMRMQLRQDFLYMQIKNLPPLHLTLENINRFYQFSFPEDGIFCFFVLGATSKVHGIIIEYQWMLDADQFLHQALSEIPGDFETLIQGPKLYCLIGSSLSREKLTGHLHNLLSQLQALQTTYICAWTMGLGRYVTGFAELQESLFSCQHALKYSIRDGIERFYDGNGDCVIYEGGLTLMTPSEELNLKRMIQKSGPDAVQQRITELFRSKEDQIRRYPVFAYMLALQIMGTSIQTLREIMPVDRKTYELYLTTEKSLDDILLLDDLIFHTISGVKALCRRYQLFLKNGRSQPIWLAITYIQEHFTENITLQDLSRVTDRNPQYISAIFSKTCGMSLKGYITSLRIEEAKRLLRSTSLPIGEIAAKVGYQDAKYFSRIFQQSAGQSPRVYREQA